MAKKETTIASVEPSAPLARSQANSPPAGNGKYTVVARRYRPKTFAELVGQSTVAQALLNAIESNRVGHAYLFTGARGVGKTSTARIFAKALNASAEANGKFDPNSDISQAIDAGEDMDVLEIDGASNRGIDEIRQLRANAAVRPSRARYKIYIIDEVHMLTNQAFNALLKTLEEPPGHVKFIFCTTDPEKMPITVLSRCQRFDFPPVHTEQIFERLKFICENEGTLADDAALRLIARRASGSMRDSQSLLEQLLSFSGGQITVEVVHSMLGTADETRLASFATRLIERDAASALRELDTAASEGVDVGQLAEQLLGYLRDMMTVTVGGSADLVRTANPNSVDQLREWGKTWGTMTLLSALQLLDETIVKMRHSVQSRILLEVALVQICNLQDLQALSDLVKAFATQSPPPARTSVPQAASALPRPGLTPPAPPAASTPAPAIKSMEDAKKKVELTTEAPPEQPPPQALARTDEFVLNSLSIPTITDPSAKTTSGKEVQPAEGAQAETHAADSELLFLREVASNIGGLAGQCASMIVRVERLSPKHWRVCLSRDGAFALNYFHDSDNSRKILSGIEALTGQEIRCEYVVTDEPTPILSTTDVALVEPEPVFRPAGPMVSQSHLIRNAMTIPLVKKFMELFEGQVVRVDPVQMQISKPHLELQTTNTSSKEATLHV